MGWVLGERAHVQHVSQRQMKGKGGNMSCSGLVGLCSAVLCVFVCVVCKCKTMCKMHNTGCLGLRVSGLEAGQGWFDFLFQAVFCGA